ncbi:hypothetical protein BDZ45DRAFT_685401 [Acephala macrosclerotiorum]|nr:hypothetical protein BDZ45DRAFT_685401 [Acephala macrosclerotiorum]
MSLGITFGSIGDLIAVGQITFMLAKALNESQGSSHNYRGLIKELRNFDQALLQHEIIPLSDQARLRPSGRITNRAPNPELHRLGVSTKVAVQDCRETLSKFKDNIEQKYGSSLDSSGTKHWVKDTSKKLLWTKEREDIEALRK